MRNERKITLKVAENENNKISLCAIVTAITEIIKNGGVDIEKS